jgi:multidrug resistance efflux pump|tara:strand:+ start:1724 stop:2764 length:1041 start_codon:yes stop_codon:yes gene_type:complete
MRNPFKKKENNNNNTPFQGIASFFLRLFYLINRMGEYIANYFLTIENQEKITEIGQFRGFKRSYILLNILIITVITLFLWSFLAKTDQVVRADGTVIPASKIQLVQSSYGGVVDKILVKLSDDVRAGDIIFEIDKDQSLINYETAKEEVTSRERKVAIFEELLASGSEAEMTIINEKLLLAEAKRRYIEAEKRYNSNRVKSPVDGKISKVNVATIGQVVGTGDLLAEVVPKDQDLIIEAQVQPKDIAKVKVGQKAKIAFSAFDSAIYGMFEGEVEKVAASTTYQEESNRVYYTARIKVIDDKVNENDKVIIQSGMQSTVSIIGNKQRVISYFLNPIKKLSQEAYSE